MSWRVEGDRARDTWGGDAPARGTAPIVGASLGGPRHADRHDANGYPVAPGTGDATPSGRPHRRGPLAGAAFGVLIGSLSSTVTTALAVGVAGKHADRFFEPIEFTIRVALLLVAPCMGAVLAALFAAVVAPKRVRPAPWAVGLGVVAGPILALRLERVLQLGVQTAVVFGVLLVCWAVVGGLLAAAASARTATRSPGHDDRAPYDRL